MDIPPNHAYDYMVKQNDEAYNLGFSRQGHYNYITAQRHKETDKRDIAILIENLNIKK